MPTLFRFLVVVLILAAIGAAGVIYLAYFVEPNQREMTVRVPANKLDTSQTVEPAGAAAEPEKADQTQ